jgi:hypothetical protein
MKSANRSLRAIGLILSSTLACNAFAADATGEDWEYKTSLSMSGMTMPMPPVRRCQSAAQAEAPPVQNNCTTSNVHTQGNTTSFEVECGPPAPMSGSGTTTRTADTISGTYTLNSDDGPMGFTVTGTRLGTCTPQ